MVRYALIDPLKMVVQVEEKGGTFEVAKPFLWVKCDTDVEVGMRYGENGFEVVESNAN